jgi:hypothetical protein
MRASILSCTVAMSAVIASTRAVTVQVLARVS